MTPLDIFSSVVLSSVLVFCLYFCQRFSGLAIASFQACFLGVYQVISGAAVLSFVFPWYRGIANPGGFVMLGRRRL